jgi:hypothetical protein
MAEIDKLIGAGKTQDIVDDIMKQTNATSPAAPHVRQLTDQERLETQIVENARDVIRGALQPLPWHLKLMALRRAVHDTIVTDVPQGGKAKAFEFFVHQLTKHLGKREI